jgi:hypothetical protein
MLSGLLTPGGGDGRQQSGICVQDFGACRLSLCIDIQEHAFGQFNRVLDLSMRELDLDRLQIGAVRQRWIDIRTRNCNAVMTWAV